MRNQLALSIGGILLLLFSFTSSAQMVTGKIIRPATNSAASGILDPGATTFTSKTSAGFLGDDVGNSRLPFKPVPTYSNEPFGDLRRGPDHLYSDFVPDANGSGVYVYFDAAQNLLIRMRIGSIVPGAKGYSLLIDADGRFGASGPNADPNYQPATTGVNGNPGFEIEVNLFTQNTSSAGIAVYNVDGSSSPGAPTYSVNDYLAYSQTSIAATNDNGDPDFFVDFYVPYSAIQSAYPGLSTSTVLRFSATTVMAPQPAIGGPKSDIYGLNDDAYKNTNTQYETYINAQPGVGLASLGGTSTTYPTTICTEPPVITTSSLTAGMVTVSGVWTKGSLTGNEVSSATIRIYKLLNGSTVGSLVTTVVGTVTSGGNWTSPSFSVAAGDRIYATAIATGESECLRSNTLQVPPACNSTNTPPRPVIPICTSGSGDYSKGFSGTNYPAGTTIFLENLSTGTIESSAATGSAFAITGSTFTYSNGCNGGANLGGGAYRVYYQNAAGCRSEPFYFCITGNGQTAISGLTTTTPIITSALTPGTSRVAGTGEVGAKVWLYVDGTVDAQSPLTIASNGTFTFTGLNLIQGQQVYVRSVFTSTTLNQNKCGASSALGTVNCYTTPPIINVDNNSQTTAGQPITGITSEAIGTTIRVYATNNTSTPVATVTVQSGGVWSTGAFVAVAGTTYYATAQNGSCTLSAASGNAAAAVATTGRCGTITGPVNAGATTVSGTLSGTAVAGTTVYLYQDDIQIGSAVTSTNTWSISALSSNLLYANGILKIGVQESGRQAQICAATITVGCNSGPTTPSITYKGCTNCTTSGSTVTLNAGGTLTYTINNPVANTYYAIKDQSTGMSLGTGLWTNNAPSAFDLTASSATAGTFTPVVVGTNISATSMCSSQAAALNNFVVLPITLIEFKGKKEGNANALIWRTGEEIGASHFEVERSTDGITYRKIGQVTANGSGSRYSYNDNQSLQTCYYRLKLMDMDGRFKYSNVIHLRQEGMAVLQPVVRPNPFVSQVGVTFSLTQPQLVQMMLTDAAGRIVLKKISMATTGINEQKLDGLGNLPQGFYVLRIDCAEVQWQQKLLKVTQ